MRIAALDIGGTSIKSGIWDGKQTLELKEWDTNASRGGACLMARAVAILHTYGDFDAIGISTAGQVDSEQGSIYYANDNIPWKMMSMRRHWASFILVRPKALRIFCV